MKSGKAVLILLTAVLLVTAVTVWALPGKTSAKAQGNVAMSHGTIVSFTATSLVLSHEVKGKKVETTFVLNPETKQEGTLAVGAKATVHYRVENKEKVATQVKVEGAKPAPKPAAQPKSTAPKTTKPK